MRVNLHLMINFREQLRLSFQPVLLLLSGLRASIQVIKVCFFGHCILRWRKISVA